MSPRGVTGNSAIKDCGESYAELSYNAMGNDFLHKSKQQTKSLISRYKNRLENNEAISRTCPDVKSLYNRCYMTWVDQ
jgi:hypothetical protein